MSPYGFIRPQWIGTSSTEPHSISLENGLEISTTIYPLLNASITAKCFPSIMKYADVIPCFKRLILSRETIDLSVCLLLYLNFMKRFKKKNKWCIILEICLMFYYLLFMDLSKAFDCLSRALIIAKWNAYGFSTAACELMGSYLRGCKEWKYQIVRVCEYIE